MSLPPPDSGILANVASVIAAFGAAMLSFRVQREIAMHEQDELTWIPWADWLLVLATLFSLLLVIIPLVVLDPNSAAFKMLPSAACASAAVLVAGYPFAILAHYRFIFPGDRTGPRVNPEPPERGIVVMTGVVSLGAFSWTIWLRL